MAPVRLHRVAGRMADMADFAQRQREVGLRERLERAIHGTGAFRRFRDLVHDEALAEQWPPSPPTASWDVLASSSPVLASDRLTVNPRSAVLFTPRRRNGLRTGVR